MEFQKSLRRRLRRRIHTTLRSMNETSEKKVYSGFQSIMKCT